MLSLLYLRVKAQQYFVSLSCLFLDRKIVLKMWLNLGLSLIIFRGTGPWRLILKTGVEVQKNGKTVV